MRGGSSRRLAGTRPSTGSRRTARRGQEHRARHASGPEPDRGAGLPDLGPVWDRSGPAIEADALRRVGRCSEVRPAQHCRPHAEHRGGRGALCCHPSSRRESASSSPTGSYLEADRTLIDAVSQTPAVFEEAPAGLHRFNEGSYKQTTFAEGNLQLSYARKERDAGRRGCGHRPLPRTAQAPVRRGARESSDWIKDQSVQGARHSGRAPGAAHRTVRHRSHAASGVAGIDVRRLGLRG